MIQYLFLFVFMALATPAWAGLKELNDSLCDSYGIEVAGFVEGAYGGRIRHDPYEKDVSLAEARLQLDISKTFHQGVFTAKGEVVSDGVTGETEGDMRELNLYFSSLENMDVKLGRQVVTWGTADMVFINDVFPKDWQSFFIGRDDEFLKAPSDAIRGKFFFDAVNIDAVYIPVEESSAHVTGDRLSYWNGSRLAGRDFIYGVNERSSFKDDPEFAMRLYRNLDSLELAAYWYSGFWKTPEGMELPSMALYYPRLNVYGASLRGPLLGAIGHIECGYYDSREDEKGDNPLIKNSEFRLVSGLEKELAMDFTAGVQYYLEWLQDYENYEQTLAPDAKDSDEFRHVFTLRLTKLLYSQNLMLSFFGYYSPSDHDGYLRPKVEYKLSDQLRVAVGANLFFSSDDHTFFGQFQKNANTFVRLRWSF